MVVKDKFVLLKNVTNILHLSPNTIKAHSVSSGQRKIFVVLEMLQDRIYHYTKDRVFVYATEYDSTKDYKVIEHHNKNVPKSEETKMKMRNSKKSHKVYKYDSNNELIQEFVSMSYCEQCEGFKKDTLRYKLDKLLPSGFLYSKQIKDIV